MNSEERSEGREWLVVGARVSTLSSSTRTSDQVRFAEVEKIGKRDIVLSDGQRFNVTRPWRHEGGPWGWTVSLMRPDDPAVVRAVAENERRLLIGRAKSACEKFLRSDMTAFDVILALAPLTGVADEIAALDTKAAS